MAGNPLATLLSGPLASVLSGVGDVIDRFVTTDKEKLEARRALLEIERQANADLLHADVEFAKAQSTVITAEAASESWLARSWRPLTMLSFTTCIFYNFLVSPLFNAPRVDIPADLWDVIKLGLTGYVAGRSLEKIAPSLADAFNKKASTK